MGGMKGKHHTEETKQKISKTKTGKKRKPHTEEGKKNISKGLAEMTPSDKRKRSKNISKATKGKKKKLFTEEHLKALRKSSSKRPTVLEYKAGLLLEEVTPDKWIYSGYVSGGKLVGKTPDFVHRKLDKCIEVNNTYFHTTLTRHTKEEEEIWQKNYWKENADYQCLILWDTDIEKNPEKVKKKILAFTC